jgi:hypothetical protein
MGYTTWFELSHNADAETTADIQLFLRANEETFYAFDEFGEGTDRYKWYEWQEDMETLSKQFPSVVFTLRGEGEESGDIWVAYFKDGKTALHHAEITFPEFDESNL